MQTDDNKPALKRLPSRLSLHWKPQPIEPPRVDEEVTQLPPIERSAEVLRFTVLKAEHWLSPNGRLREWLRFNFVAALIIGVPALLIIPIITFILGAFATWMAFLALAAWTFLCFVGSVIAAIALVTAALMVCKGIRRQ